jgi:hypothetical protein
MDEEAVESEVDVLLRSLPRRSEENATTTARIARPLLVKIWNRRPRNSEQE